MNNYRFSFITLLIFYHISLFGHFATHADVVSFSRVPKQLETVVAKLLGLSEAYDLLAQVSQEGPVGIVMQNDPKSQLDAIWNADARLIKVNPCRHSSEGSWIISILFELHNASTSKQLLALFYSAETNQVSKEVWVEQMERMEHINALNTCRLLNKGISLGIYPMDAQWTIFYSFNDYYKFQQLAGHSQWLAKAYDRSNPYSKRVPFRGTIVGLDYMTAKEKKNLEKHLVKKNKA